MVLLGRIELPTSPLPRVRSTTELQQRATRHAEGAPGRGALLSAHRGNVKLGLQSAVRLGIRAKMVEMPEKPTPDKATREERLAAKLRENLHRRKAQARALASPSGMPAQDRSENDSGALPNPPPES